MVEHIKEIIDQIKTEGVEAAENNANEIKDRAKQEANTIIEDAKKQSESMIHEAKEEIAKLKKSGEMALAQASRDTLLSLRQQIEALFKEILKKEVQKSLNAEDITKVLNSVIKDCIDKADGDVNICIDVKPEDLKVLQDGLYAQLQEKVKSGIELRSQEGIQKGFTISFDGGKSCIDFSDESLVEYLQGFLNESLSEIIKTAVNKKG